jgi:serpin B
LQEQKKYHETQELDSSFKSMTDVKGIYISEVLHKAFVEVNEEGTEAAAATVVTDIVYGVRDTKPTFRADRPFIFIIKENRAGTILFMGRVVNPAG